MTVQLRGFSPDLRYAPEFTTPALSTWRRLFYSPLKFLAADYPVVKGFDVNHWHYCSDYPAAKAAGYEWVGIKATEGLTVKDAKFTDQWQKAIDAGLFVLPYHFFRCNLSGADQAEFFMETIFPFVDATGGVLLPPGVDVETTDGQTLTVRQNKINACLDTLKVEHEPCVYSSPALWSSVAGNMPMTHYGWVAHWTAADLPTLPTGWDVTKRLFWQYGVHPTYAWAEHVPGVNEPIDVDRYFGTLEDLQTLAGVEELSLETLDDRLTVVEDWIVAHQP